MGAHAHSHEHTHGHAHAHAPRQTSDGADDRRRLLLALGLTLTIFVAEVAGGLYAGSLALLSDAGHMMTDASAQLISLFAVMFAARPADDRRSYGYRRWEILAALANGVLLGGLAAYTLVTAAARFAEPTPVRAGIVLVVAAIGLVANLTAAWLLHGSRSMNVRGAYLHIVSDTLSSVAVLAGAAAMTLRDGLELLDPILGCTIGLFVLWSAARLTREAVDVLLEAVPPHLDLERVRLDLAAIAGVEAVHDLHVWTLGTGVVALSAHVVAGPGVFPAGYDQLLCIIDEVARRHGIHHSTVQVETQQHDCAPQAH